MGIEDFLEALTTSDAVTQAPKFDPTGKASKGPSGPRTTEPVISTIDFTCPTCEQKVKGDRGYYVAHDHTFVNRYGTPVTRMCPRSNNKIKDELRVLKLHGRCGDCGTEFDHELKEEFPGGLPIEGGYMEVACVLCTGKTTATCVNCGDALSKVDDEWRHDNSGKHECPFDPEAAEVEPIDDLDEEFFDAAPREQTYAEPLSGTERTAPLSMVTVSDGFTITEPEQEESGPQEVYNHG